MKRKAVLFDLDGTLLDTIEDLTDSMNAALCELDAPQRTSDECKLLVGDGRDAFASRALPPDRRDQATVERCVELMTAYYWRNWAAKTGPYDGIEQLLGSLPDAGLEMVVLSNKYDESVKTLVSHFFDGVDFKIVRGARHDVPRKPDPTAALAIAEQLGLQPADFLYLGDTDTDMQTARAAGMYAVGVLWGFRPAEELTANGAHALIAHPMELMELIGRG